MENKKRVPLSEGKSENGKPHISAEVQVDFTTGCQARQEVVIGQVEMVLRSKNAVGQEHAVTRREVAVALGLAQADGPRTVSKLLEKERQTRVICSCKSGLFLPSEGLKGQLEIRAYRHKVEGVAKGAFRSLKAARLRQKVLDGQTTFEDQEEG